MKSTLVRSTLLIFLLALPDGLFAQDCESHFKTGDCKMDMQRGYKINSQSKGFPITTRDTIELNLVFYGLKDYVFSFCANSELYPIHFQIIDPETESILYDNEEDRYLESLGIGFDDTKKLRFKIHALGKENNTGDKHEYAGCLAMLIQYKNYD